MAPIDAYLSDISTLRFPASQSQPAEQFQPERPSSSFSHPARLSSHRGHHRPRRRQSARCLVTATPNHATTSRQSRPRAPRPRPRERLRNINHNHRLLLAPPLLHHHIRAERRQPIQQDPAAAIHARAFAASRRAARPAQPVVELVHALLGRHRRSKLPQTDGGRRRGRLVEDHQHTEPPRPGREGQRRDGPGREQRRDGRWLFEVSAGGGRGRVFERRIVRGPRRRIQR